MLQRIITYGLGENLIDNIADLLIEKFAKDGNDFSRIACVFGGRRPSLFLRKKLSDKIKKPYLPPSTFSMDEFVEYILGGQVKRIKDLDCAYFIYGLIKKEAPSILGARSSFSQFLGWGSEISSFIEQLDLEDISDQALVSIEKSAEIGYEVPQSINVLLQHIVKIRRHLHQMLDKNNLYSRGNMYLKASRIVSGCAFDEFDAIIFCGCFYLHSSEERIIKTIYDKAKGILIFQGSQDNWSVLKSNAKRFGIAIKAADNISKYELKLYQGFDMHSQSSLVHKILKDEDVKLSQNTVIVLPKADILVPLISEISLKIEEFNVSMGYPLKMSAVYVLFDCLYKVQRSRKGDRFYTKDYLNLLRHPLIKNLEIGSSAVLSRVMVHKIEELLRGSQESVIGGTSFLTLDEIEAEDKIFTDTSATLTNMGIEADAGECKDVLEQIHYLLFREWQDLCDFGGFAVKLRQLVDVLINRSMVCHFSFNLKIIEKLQDIEEEFKALAFSKVHFSADQIWEVFLQRLQSQMVSFIGSPLGGVQILGLFETRALNFDNVIVVDTNESVLPKLKVYEPLIPREVMLSLGLNRLEKEEEIQRYHFMRLLAGARGVYLVYDASQDKEKSRFIEELLWSRQKQQAKLEVLTAPKASFSVNVFSKPLDIVKTPEIIEFLKGQTYSASRINTYLRCPLQFYYQYVLGLKENQDLLEDPQSSHIGNFIHKLLEETFLQFKGEKPVINKEFRNYFFKRTEELFEEKLSRRMKSDAFLLKKIVTKRLQKFLDNEAKRDILKIICLEERRYDKAILNNEHIKFTYTVDRVDELSDHSIEIIDYKTGNASFVPKKYAKLKLMENSRPSIKENIKSFQLPLYYYFIKKQYPDVEVSAHLYSIRNLERTPFIYEQDSAHRQEIVDICMQALEAIFLELFNPAVNFEPDREDRKCKKCPFALFCS